MSLTPAPRGHYFEDFEVGMEFVSPARTVTQTDIVNFACLSGDFNEVHTNFEYCKTTKAGEPYVGKLIEDTNERVVIQTNPMLPQRVELKRSEIDSRRPSPLSPMPTGLINVLSKDEILDMMAYLEAGGKADHPDFAK